MINLLTSLLTVIVIQSAGTFEPVDWTDSFVAVWRMEDNNSWPNETVGCGSDCDMSETGTVVQDTVSFMEGSASQEFDATVDDDYLSCNNSTTCEEMSVSGSVTVGGWIDFTADDTIRVWHQNTGNTGIYVERVAAGDKLRCHVGDGTDMASPAIGGANTYSVADGWVHWACVHDASADTIQLYDDGETDGSSVPQQDMAAYTGALNRFGSTTGSDFFLDEWFQFDGVLTQAQLCRICSCGIDGAGCACSDATSYSDAGLNTTDCSSCTLPACTAAAP
jgi:hypothetical protein